MKKILFILALFFMGSVLFANIHKNIQSDIQFTVKTNYFTYKDDKIYLRSYISIPLKELKYKKASTKNGKTNYRVKLLYSVKIYIEGKVIKKDSWKSIVNFQIVNENANILNFYDIGLPSNSKYKYEITVKDMYKKNEGVLSFEEKTPNFKEFSISSLLWSKNNIRKATPDDYKYLIFNNLFIYPILENKLKQYHYPRLYFEIYGLTPDEDDFYQFKVNYDILNEKNIRIYHLEQNYSYDENEVPIVVSPYVFDVMALLDKGFYKVKITVQDLNKKENNTLEKETNFIIN